MNSNDKLNRRTFLGAAPAAGLMLGASIPACGDRPRTVAEAAPRDHP